VWLGEPLASLEILVAEEIQGGQPVVTFKTCKGLTEAAFLRVAGGSSVLQTSVVAGAGFSRSFSPPLLVPAQRRRVGQMAGANQ